METGFGNTESIRAICLILFKLRHIRSVIGRYAFSPPRGCRGVSVEPKYPTAVPAGVCTPHDDIHRQFHGVINEHADKHGYAGEATRGKTLRFPPNPYRVRRENDPWAEEETILVSKTINC